MPLRVSPSMRADFIALSVQLTGATEVGVRFNKITRSTEVAPPGATLDVVEIGVQLLRVLSLSGLFIAVALTYTGGLQGTGDTRSPLYISIVSQIIVPLGICFAIQRLGTLDPIDVWVAILVGHATRCVLSVVRFNQGKWRNITVDLERTEG